MAENLTAQNFLYALLGGFLPALFWLWFWLKEDKKRPEPRGVLISTFIAGMIAVVVALGLEHLVVIAGEKINLTSTLMGLGVLLLLWSFIEEFVKYLAAKYAALNKKSFDEPIDALIYLITAALGFAALENTMFLIKAFDTGPVSVFITGNLRFLGATLLHVACSAIVGASIGFAFFRKEKMHRNIVGGLFLSTLLHFLFNYYIMTNKNNDVLGIFIPLWIIIIVIIFIFEKVKRIKS